AVHHAGDVAVEPDVTEIILRRLDLARIFFGEIAHVADVGVAIQGVVVEAHFAVERQEIALLRQHERVDLREGAIGLRERLVEAAHEYDRLVDGFLRQAEREGEVSCLVCLQADRRIDHLAKDLLRTSCRHLFDLDPTLARGHHRQAADRTIEHHAEVELACDVATFLDEHTVDLLALGPRLVRDQPHADHPLGDLAGFGGALGELDAATFAAATGVDLRLHHAYASAELLRRRFGFGRVAGDLPARDVDLIAPEDFLRLIFVNVHRAHLETAKEAGSRWSHRNVQWTFRSFA